MAKIELANYETKSNRKKLISAYSDKSPVVKIMYMENDIDIVAMTDNNRVLCLSTSKIPLKATKSTQGVQVVTMRKKGAKLIDVKTVSESGIENPKKYETRNIPAAGSVMKSEDAQMSLI